jgi:signal transduction histidine kinase
MRERLVVAFVAVAVAVVAVFLVERAYTTSGLIRAQQQREVQHTAETVAVLVADRTEAPSRQVLERVVAAGDWLEYVAGDGTRVTAGRPAAEADGGPDDFVGRSAVAGGGSVVVTRPVAVVEAEVAEELLPLVLVALALVTSTALAGVWLARRLSRPFVELAAVAREIGRGSFDVPVARYAVPEADAVAGALRAGARDLAALVRRERDFAANASHDLRTPITALRLELEDLRLAAATQAGTVAALDRALHHLDRLSASVARLLDESRRDRIDTAWEIDLAAVVRDVAARWQRQLPHRSIDADTPTVVAARLPTGTVVQALEALVANAVTHGQGRVSVRLRECDGYLELSVGDEGPCGPAAAGARAGGSGRGLVLAQQVARALGGQLRLTESATTTFCLTLPVTRSLAEPVAATTG